MVSLTLGCFSTGSRQWQQDYGAPSGLGDAWSRTGRRALLGGAARRYFAFVEVE
jgi:hypothetical protein